jgi:lysine-ketoglutarate reductase/saccharopine dehydrogenase-like protein (TIGR00300 family)
MCRPDFYAVDYVINPWMAGNVGRSTRTVAQEQWDGLRTLLTSFAQVSLVEPKPELPDMPFTANTGLVYDDWFIPAKFRYRERAGEVPFCRSWFESEGFRIHDLAGSGHFEGEGDALFQPGEALLWGGYGFRTSLQAYEELSRVTGVRVEALRLVDRRFYHLDTCFCPLPGGRAIYFPNAFDGEALARIRDHFEAGSRYEVSSRDALQFACNAVVAGKVFVSNFVSNSLREQLDSWDFDVRTTPLSEFMLAGGAAKCLALGLNHNLDSMARTVAGGPGSIARRTLHIRGQLLDTDLMNASLDSVIDGGGSFEIRDFDPGMQRDEESAASIEVFAPNRARLERIVGRIVQLGARATEEPEDAALEEVSHAGVAPPDFYSTTIYPTEVRIEGGWILAEQQRMDAVLVVDLESSKARCATFRDLEVGDRIVCGIDGIRVHPETHAADAEDFAFMASDVSSERRVELAIDRIAWTMKRIRDRNGRIVVVAGPVVVHTGGAPYLAKLIREGYVSALLGGNAIAVHDIERAMYGTSLGLDLDRGIGVPGGHRHHLRAINEVRACGSIAAAVKRGFITSGIMYECIQNDIPFSLAGSIRDDGPLPDTRMDLIVAQREYAYLIEGSDLILMMASMLHSIGVGNMTPSGVQLICVDINPAVATKLSDRGSVECTSVVTDVGLFLGQLSRRLDKHLGD